MDLNKIPENAENSKRECAVTAKRALPNRTMNLIYTKHCNVG